LTRLVMRHCSRNFPANGIVVIHKQHSIGKLGNRAARESQPKGDPHPRIDGTAPQKAR